MTAAPGATKILALGPVGLGRLLLALLWRHLHPRRLLHGISLLFSASGRRLLAQEIKASFFPDPLLRLVEPVRFEAEPGRAPALDVLLPSLEMARMTGGSNTAILLALAVARLGMPVRFISLGRADAEAPLRKHLEHLSGRPVDGLDLGFVEARDRRRAVRVGERDVFLATAWWSAHIAKQGLAATKARELLYLIQEFEPSFYPWSVLWQHAMDTYRFPFRAVINESLLADYFQKHAIGNFAIPGFLDRCAVFEPAIDEDVFHAREARPGGGKRRLLFYARVHAPRNLFELGLLALERAVERGAFPPDRWELLFLGDGHLESVDLGGGRRIRQHPWESYVDYGANLRRSDVGLSLMLSPHTSYPPLEMAASGMQVVTNTFDVKTAAALAAISRNIVPVAPEAGAIADGLLEACRRVEESGGARDDGGMRLPRSWPAALEPVVPRFLAMIREISGLEPASIGPRPEGPASA